MNGRETMLSLEERRFLFQEEVDNMFGGLLDFTEELKQEYEASSENPNKYRYSGELILLNELHYKTLAVLRRLKT